jgi:DNA polymerase III epsilon subunit-like protein
LKKVIECWYDVETTGLKVKDGAAVVQIAFLIVEDGKVVKEFSSTINPYSYKREITISPEAMAINGYKEEDFEAMPKLYHVLSELMHFCTTKYPNTKLTLIGYNNSTFDKYFLEDMFTDQGKLFHLYFNWKQIDIFETVKYMQFSGLIGSTFNQKLGTIAEYLGVKPKGELHDALVDVYVTRDIHLKIQEKLA